MIDLHDCDVTVYLMNRENNKLYCQTNYKIKGKEGFIMLPKLKVMDEFSIYVKYPENCKLFTGQSTNNNAYDGEVTFTFQDNFESVFDYFGPILGFLYSLD